MNQFLTFFLSLLVLVLIASVFLYFYMRSIRNGVQKAWIDLLDKLNLRLDKIPNLIETIRSNADDENDLCNQLIALREKTWPLDKADKHRVHVELDVSDTLRNCWKLAHKYDSLKHNVNYLNSRGEFKDLSGEIEDSLEVYNEKVRVYNKSFNTIWYKPLLLIMPFKRLHIFEFER